MQDMATFILKRKNNTYKKLYKNITFEKEIKQGNLDFFTQEC